MSDWSATRGESLLKPPTVVYIAVRRDRGEEWVDLSSTSYDREACSRQAKEPGGRSRTWLDLNSLVRIGTFRLEEVKP